MSTYSPSLRVELLNTGTNAGTWGNTTNDNFSTVFDAAIAGVATVSVTSADQALTYVNGPTSTAAANESVRAVLSVSSTGSANLYAPPVSKLYIVKNTGSYPVTLYNSTVIGNTTAAGTGVAIPADKTMAVWSDGTNFTQQTNHLISPTLASATLTSPTMSSPTMTGTPVAPTAAPGTNTTQIATTAFTTAAITAATGSLGTMSTQNANNVNVTGGSVTGLSSLTTSGAATIGGYLYTGAVISTSSGAFVSPNATTSGAVVLRDYAGNPDAVYLQAANNEWTVQYGYLKFNSNGTLTPSGTINGNISGNAATATNATNATNATDSTNGLIRGSYGNYSGSRSLGVTYTNSTGKMLWVAVAWDHTGTGAYYGYVNGNLAYWTDQDLYPRANVNLLVPPGGTYVVYSGAGDTFLYWFELR